MSELIQENDNRATIRWKLLTGVSALALTAYISSANLAKAEDTSRPTIWIELGGQMEQLEGLNAPFIAPFMTAITPTPAPYHDNIFADGQKPPRFSFGEEGEISFQPEGSDWVFSASIRYGRSRTNQHIHQQSPAPVVQYPNHTHTLNAKPFANVGSSSGEQHTILDLSAGRDVGLGMLGPDGSSTISAGVRFAQFSENSGVKATGRPSIYVAGPGGHGIPLYTFYNYTMVGHAARNFHGVGPSLSWNASASLAGNKASGELSLDWGINGALLFGRQKAKTSHSTQAYHLPITQAYGGQYDTYYYTRIYQRPHNSPRSHAVTVPNIGGFVGVSMKYPNVKFSIGYRYDTFLKAMDTGIDVRKTSNLTFNGPYASISIGLGD